MKIIRSLVLATTMATFSSIPTVNHADAQLAAATIGSAIQNIQDLAKQLEDGAQVLLQQGNIALAQQQMIAAGILKQLVTQLSETYKGRLDDTFEKVGVAQSNVATDIQGALGQVKDIETKTAFDAQNSIYQLQGSINQILNKLPLVGHDPAFYGMVVHDVYAELPKTGVDLEFIGLNLTDGNLQFKQPAVEIGGNPIPDKDIAVQQDRVQVIIPDDIKKKIGFTASYCDPPNSFSAKITAFYQTTSSFLFIPSHEDTSVTFNAFALNAPDNFVANVKYSGVTSVNQLQDQTFSTSSAQVTYGCEENNSGGVSVNLPPEAQQINCNASWINLSNTGTQGASCAVGGTTVTASGTVRGRDRQCIVTDVLSGGLFRAIVGRKTACNCPGGGHGTLLLQGTYKMPKIVQQNFADIQIPAQKFLDNTDVILPSDAARRIQEIKVSIARPQCSVNMDQATLSLPTDATAIASQKTENGMFDIVYRAERLSISKSK